jgi:uncharacterized membrane protein YadS
MVTLNSVIDFPQVIERFLQVSAQLLLTVAMAALGLQTQFSAIKAAGSKPLILSSVLFLLLMGGGLAAHQALY